MLLFTDAYIYYIRVIIYCFWGGGQYEIHFSVFLVCRQLCHEKKKVRKKSVCTRKCNKPIIPVFTLGQETVSNLRVGLSSSSSSSIYTVCDQIRLPTTRLTKKRRTVKLLVKFDFLHRPTLTQFGFLYFYQQ